VAKAVGSEPRGVHRVDLPGEEHRVHPVSAQDDQPCPVQTGAVPKVAAKEPQNRRGEESQVAPRAKQGHQRSSRVPRGVLLGQDVVHHVPKVLPGHVRRGEGGGPCQCAKLRKLRGVCVEEVQGILEAKVAHAVRDDVELLLQRAMEPLSRRASRPEQPLADRQDITSKSPVKCSIFNRVNGTAAVRAAFNTCSRFAR
jgi:hypothetical protein